MSQEIALGGGTPMRTKVTNMGVAPAYCYQRNARKQVIATCNRQRGFVCSVILMRTNRHSKSRDQRIKKGYKSYHDLSDYLSVTKIRNFNP